MRLEKFFQKIGKWLTFVIKYKKVTYSNSSLKLWRERKYAIELIPVKSYEEGLSCGKESETYHKSLAKACKGVFTIANTSVYSNVSQYFGAIMTCEKFVSTINI